MSDYPNLWKRGLIQPRVRERAGHKCEQCGKEFHPGTNLAVSAVRLDGKAVIGGVHHIDGNKQNCSMRNLVYLYQYCHLFVQYRWLPGAVLPLQWMETPAWIISRQLPFEVHPQLRLWS